MAYNTRDLLLYAAGIGEKAPTFSYEHCENFQAFPTYPFALEFKGDAADVVSFPSPAMLALGSLPPLKGLKAALDGEREIEVLRPLDTVGAHLVLRSRLVGLFRKGSGAVAHRESYLEGADDGTRYCRMTSSSFLVGARGFEESGTSLSRKLPPPQRPPDAVRELRVPEGLELIFRLSGDYNPLHADAGAARGMGFDRPILHGLCTLGHTARAFVDEYCGGGWKSLAFLWPSLR